MTTLKDLPPPPADKTGWPWTVETPTLPERMEDGREWPRISIVTPSYNQGAFIEETIRSVLLQGYPNLEYIVIDGGSSDESVEVIRNYEPWLAHWVSESDRGQCNAINKGMSKATGEIVAWLNSDDVYLPKAFASIGGAWVGGTTHWMVGKIKYGEAPQSTQTQTLALSSSRTFLEVAAFWLVRERNLRTFTQPEVFVSREAWNHVGGLFEGLKFSMDYHLWAKLSAVGYVPAYVPEEVAFFRIHKGQKTQQSNQSYQIRVLGERSWSLLDAIDRSRCSDRPQPDTDEVAHLLEKKAGGFCRILDAYFSGKRSWGMLGPIVSNAVRAPRSTLGSRSRSVIREICFSNGSANSSN